MKKWQPPRLMPAIGTRSGKCEHARSSLLTGVVMINRVLAAFCLCAGVAGIAHAADARPHYGRWGFDAAGADMALKPGEEIAFTQLRRSANTTSSD